MKLKKIFGTAETVCACGMLVSGLILGSVGIKKGYVKILSVSLFVSGTGEGLNNEYPNMTREEMFPLFQENGNGLTIITNGGKEFFYGRKGGKIKTFQPFKVDVKSTLGAVRLFL